MTRVASFVWVALPVVLLAACSDGAPANPPSPDVAADEQPAVDQPAPLDQAPPDQPAPLDAPVDEAPPVDAADASDAASDDPAPADVVAPPDAPADSSDVAAPPDALDDVPAPMDAPTDSADVAPLPDAPEDVAPPPDAPPDVADAAAPPDVVDVASPPDVSVDTAVAPCARNSDCAGSALGPVCDTATGACVPCTAADRGACAAGQYCTSAQRCEAGCGADTDCSGAAARCDVAAHRCVACVTDAHCPAGMRCSADRTCAPPPPTSCAVILRRDPSARSGTFSISPAGTPIDVTCDFSTGRGYTFFNGTSAPATASAILGACPAGTAAFQVRSEAHAAALRRYVLSPSPTESWYQANFFAGPAASCPTLAAQGGWLRSAAEWVDASVRPSFLAPLDFAENCLNAGAFDPIQLNNRAGYANRGCTGCRVLYNQTEQDLAATVVCSVNDLPACAVGAEDCDGDAGNGCEVRVDTDASNCGACNRRCAAGESCSAGACALRRAGTFLPPPPTGPASSPEVMASGIAGPQGILVAPDGRVYVSALVAGTILRIDPSVTPAVVTTFATGFSEPAQLAMNAPDAIVVAERTGGRVTRIAVNADGSAGARTMVASGFSGPWGVTWEPSGALLVSNEFGDTVDRVSSTGVVTRGVVSGFNAPLDMRYDADGRLWVAQYFGTALGNGTLVHLYDPSLTRLRSTSGFSGPIGIALDAAGNAYVSSYDGGAAGVGRVLRVTPDGAVTPFATGLTGPHAVAFDARGALWVCDYGTNRVVRIVAR